MKSLASLGLLFVDFCCPKCTFVRCHVKVLGACQKGNLFISYIYIFRYMHVYSHTWHQMLETLENTECESNV